jgi:ubiquinone/menaquinone biosynthesis C-methylase UbiE
MTVVDYGCGPGRYIRGFAHAVGDKGMVYAADVHELALKYVRCKIAKYHLENVEPVFIKGSSSLIPDKTADMICAFDMFHQVENPEEFLNELHRLAKKTCQLILDDGHQSREETLRKVSACRVWKIDEEHKDHLRCSPVY